jgi:hypothetical protein
MTAMMGTNIAVLTLTCALSSLTSTSPSAQTVVRGLAVRAEIIAANSTAALAFQNEADAREVLSALCTEPHTVTACLYDKDGRVFVT